MRTRLSYYHHTVVSGLSDVILLGFILFFLVTAHIVTYRKCRHDLDNYVSFESLDLLVLVFRHHHDQKKKMWRCPKTLVTFPTYSFESRQTEEAMRRPGHNRFLYALEQISRYELNNTKRKKEDNRLNTIQV